MGFAWLLPGAAHPTTLSPPAMAAYIETLEQVGLGVVATRS
jgi:hypothetical protein